MQGEVNGREPKASRRGAASILILMEGSGKAGEPLKPRGTLKPRDPHLHPHKPPVWTDLPNFSLSISSPTKSMGRHHSPLPRVGGPQLPLLPFPEKASPAHSSACYSASGLHSGKLARMQPSSLRHLRGQE